MHKNPDYDDILSLVTHDLKSPMTAIMGELEILSLDNLTKKEKNDSLKSAKKASKSMIKLIENILVMAKIEAGKEIVEFRKINDLQSEFINILKTFKYEAKSKNIELNLKIGKKLPKVFWDIDKLHYHAFNNILSNSLKFTPNYGEIEFAVYKESKNILISIKDNGIGIEKSKQKDIFKKFETHNNKKKYKGTGLGLYNAYNFITKHKGSIKIENGLDNKGVGFLISLPINPSKQKEKNETI